MRKCDALWAYIQGLNEEKLIFCFADVEKIDGTPLDHFFSTYKKEFAQYGYAVGKISMKSQTVLLIQKENDRL